MQYLFYVIIFVAVVSVATGLINSIFFPFVAIRESELPATIRRQLADYFPELRPHVVRQQKARQRFQIDGKLEGRSARIIFVVTPDSEINRVELTTLPMQPFITRIAIEHSQVPAHVAASFDPFLTTDQTPFQSRKAVAGMIGNQNAYQVEFDTAKYQYRFEASDSGELIGFRKKSVA